MPQQKGAAKIELGQIQLRHKKASFCEVLQNQNKILAKRKQVLPLLVFTNRDSATQQNTCDTKTQGFYIYTKILLGHLLKKYCKLKNRGGLPHSQDIYICFTWDAEYRDELFRGIAA